MPHFSFLIPVYNRPDELAELLGCLNRQTVRDFEVVVVEDGSKIRAEEVVNRYRDRLDLQYIKQENTGQGFARNTAMRHARGTYFIILDSDALVEPDFLEIIAREVPRQGLDFHGGPDREHPDFTPIQKAISYSMTSVFTTGGIRGKAQSAGGTFHPRSFNMGLSRKVWEKTGGFQTTRMGEDILFSIRAQRMGFRSGLIPEAFIYHKRRTSFRAFFRQLRFFGRARINISRYYPDTLKLVHAFPAAFTLFLALIPVWLLTVPPLGVAALGVLAGYLGLVFLDSTRRNGSVRVGGLSMAAVLVQLTGYGLGFLTEGWTWLREPKGTRQTGAAVEYPQ
jgi:glycosyltransferase involved in cell wall biosynthesis